MSGKYLRILAIAVIAGIVLVCLLALGPENSPLPEKTENTVGLWGDCNPNITDCGTGLECVYYHDDVYKCMKYLKDGEECGRSVAEVCDTGLACVDTDATRTVCSPFTAAGGGQECSQEPLQICEPSAS